MAKKKMQHEAQEGEVPGLPQAGALGSDDPLMHEVQTFLTQRDALARKLAAEIEATERKLEELKQTAARLFPQGEEPSGRERKARKTKTKASGRPPRSESPEFGEDRIPGGGG